MITFDSAPHEFASLIFEHLGKEEAEKGRIVRDIYGQLSFATSSRARERIARTSEACADLLGAYAGRDRSVVISVDAARLRALSRQSSVEISVPNLGRIRMIDRKLAGEDWLTPASKLAKNPQRLVFYSIKGGVGRSTGLAVTAANLAAQNLNVLILDLDLEAPGLGSILLHPDDIPDYGVLDWFAALAAGAELEPMIPDMTGSSPFTSSSAIVDVVPAVGKIPGAYISKLARAYTPGSSSKNFTGFSFPDKVNHLIEQLCKIQRYDVVLIDARAGLHETSGGIILGLGAKSLLFGVDTSQTFDDFSLLFQAFRDAFDPALKGEDLRNSFKMVHAKAPRDDRELRRFRERSWELWSSYLYDDLEPSEETRGTAFIFDLVNEEAPHYPLEIIGDDSYARFDPRTDTYALDAVGYTPVFGRFLEGVQRLLGLK